TYLGSSRMEAPRKRRRRRFKLLPFVSWQTALNTVKLAPTSSVSLLPLHEPVVEHTCPTCFGHTSSHRLDRQATIRFSPHTFPSRLDFVFAFHDQEELGPRMLARIAKRRPQPSAQETVDRI